MLILSWYNVKKKSGPDQNIERCHSERVTESRLCHTFVVVTQQQSTTWPSRCIYSCGSVLDLRVGLTKRIQMCWIYTVDLSFVYVNELLVSNHIWEDSVSVMYEMFFIWLKRRWKMSNSTSTSNQEILFGA